MLIISLTVSPGCVLALVGHQFQVVEAELRAVEALADDGEDVAAFDGVALRRRSALYERRYCPACEAVDLLLGRAFGVGVEVASV